jgi:hypothetical protein
MDPDACGFARMFAVSQALTDMTAHQQLSVERSQGRLRRHPGKSLLSIGKDGNEKSSGATAMACAAHAAGDASSNDSMGDIHVRLRAISIEPDVTTGGALGTLGVGVKF